MPDPLSLYLGECAESKDKISKTGAKLSTHKVGTSPDSQVGQESVESFCSCRMKSCINVPAYKRNLPQHIRLHTALVLPRQTLTTVV